MLPLAISLSKLSNLVQIVGVLGIALVILQIGIGLRNSRVELITNLTTMITQIDRVFIEHPTMRKYFEDGKTPRDDHTERARAVALTMANTPDHIVEHMRLLSPQTEGAWKTYIHDVHANSPVFREVLNNHPSWWPGLQIQVHRLPAKNP